MSIKSAKRPRPAGDILVRKFPLQKKPFNPYQAGELRQEAARCWNAVCTVHRLFYARYGIWIGEATIKKFLKGRFRLHSQTVQAIVELYFECCDRTREIRKEEGGAWRYPYRKKSHFVVTWKKAALKRRGIYLLLSNGRGNEPLIVKLPQRLWESNIHQVQLVWHRTGYWLHVSVEEPPLHKAEGSKPVGADPGEVHVCAFTDGVEALVVSGRGLRSLKRLRNKELGKFQKRLSRLSKGSRRWRKTYRAKLCFLEWIDRRIEHLEHAGTAKAVRWCVNHHAGVVYLGDPDGVRDNAQGNRHNQRMGQWTYGRTAELLKYKLRRLGIKLTLVDERGTSGTCPKCGQYSKQHGRVFKCSHCGFSGAHRDVVGASGILDKSVNGGFTVNRLLPRSVTYLRPTGKAIPARE